MSYVPLHTKSESSSSAGDNEHLLSDTESQFQSQSQSQPQSQFRQPTHQKSFLLQILICILIAIVFLGSGFWIGSQYGDVLNKNAICLNHVQKWSPIQAEVDNTYHTVQFNGSLMKTNAFRGPAGPETDAAWESIGVNYRSLRVPTSQAARSGLRPDQVQISPSHGGGYPANVEGLHHLHCLNLLRQSLYYNYAYYSSLGTGAFVNSVDILQHHVSHCLDIIRQQLMCTPDTGLLGQIWWDPASPQAFVDFNTEHKCKNFDAIRQWAEERQIAVSVPEDFLMPPREGDVLEHLP